MTVVSALGNGPTQPVAMSRRAVNTAGASAFAVPDSEPAAPPESVAPVALPVLLALQEAETEAVRDRAARRHAEAILKTLGALQRALLGGTGGAHAMAGLVDQLQGAPAPADPRPATVQKLVLQRAAIEAARLRLLGDT